jgi:hypothetical protein
VSTFKSLNPTNLSDVVAETKLASADDIADAARRAKAAQKAWANSEKVIKLIGYDADEQRRAKDFCDDKYEVKYPLIEWGMGRDECVISILDAGLPLPGKSACFFCPSSKPKEIRQLGNEYPELLKRAISMEENALENLTSVKGLGRNWSWKEMTEFEGRQIDMFRMAPEIPCGCYDGGSDD